MGYVSKNMLTKATGAHFNENGHKISYMQITIIETSWAALVSNSLFGWSFLRLYHILLESVLDVPRKLPLKFH